MATANLSSTGQEKHTALLFILQNCAANLCGMITPFGNPQNLYLFSYYGLSTKTFFSPGTGAKKTTGGYHWSEASTRTW